MTYVTSCFPAPLPSLKRHLTLPHELAEGNPLPIPLFHFSSNGPGGNGCHGAASPLPFSLPLENLSPKSHVLGRVFTFLAESIEATLLQPGQQKADLTTTLSGRHLQLRPKSPNRQARNRISFPHLDNSGCLMRIALAERTQMHNGILSRKPAPLECGALKPRQPMSNVRLPRNWKRRRPEKPGWCQCMRLDDAPNNRTYISRASKMLGRKTLRPAGKSVSCIKAGSVPPFPRTLNFYCVKKNPFDLSVARFS